MMSIRVLIINVSNWSSLYVHIKYPMPCLSSAFSYGSLVVCRYGSFLRSHKVFTVANELAFRSRFAGGARRADCPWNKDVANGCFIWPFGLSVGLKYK